MFVSVITDYSTIYDVWRNKDDYFDVDDVRILKDRVLVHHDGRILQIPLDGRHSVLIR